MKTYSEKLRDPRWQRKRLEIMQRDNFTCTQCGNKSEIQNIHHWQYSKEPWSAKNQDLTTVCRSCHEEIEHCKNLTKVFLRQPSFRKLVLNILATFNDSIDVAEDVDYCIPLPNPEGFSNIRYDVPLPVGITKSDLPNMASHCKQEVCGSRYYEGVFVQWDEDYDERVLGIIMSIPPDIRKSLIVIQEHKASLGLIWKNKVPIGYEVDSVFYSPDGDTFVVSTSWALYKTEEDWYWENICAAVILKDEPKKKPNTKNAFSSLDSLLDAYE